MKRIITTALAIVLALSLFGCSREKTATTPAIGETELSERDIAVVPMTDEEKAGMEKKPPVVGVEYNEGETVSYTFASYGTYTWSYDNGDGTTTGVCSDSAHALQFEDSNIATIKQKNGQDSAKIGFSKQPDSFEVTRWSEECRGDNASQYFDSGEKVDVSSDGTFTLNTDGKGHVYEIHAVWDRGDAYYCFMITAA